MAAGMGAGVPSVSAVLLELRSVHRPSSLAAVRLPAITSAVTLPPLNPSTPPTRSGVPAPRRYMTITVTHIQRRVLGPIKRAPLKGRGAGGVEHWERGA